MHLEVSTFLSILYNGRIVIRGQGGRPERVWLVVVGGSIVSILWLIS
jgi:hypothetical protein